MKPVPTAMVVLLVLAAACGTADLPANPEPPHATPPVWAPAMRIDLDATLDHSPRVAVSSQGRVIAVWTRDVPGRRGSGIPNSQRSSRYTRAVGWSAAESIPLLETRDQVSSVAIDDEGTAYVVGTTYVLGDTRPDSRPRVWSSHSTSMSTWSAPELLPGGGGDAIAPRVAFIDSRMPLVVWEEVVAPKRELWASARLEGVGWTRAQMLSDSEHGIGSMTLVGSGRGQALVLWNLGGGNGEVFARVFDRATGWTDAERIGAAGVELTGAFAGGQAFAIWPSPKGLFMSVRSESGSWIPEMRGPSRERLARRVRLALDDSGNGLALWQDFGSLGPGADLYAARYERQGGWLPSQLVGTATDFESHGLVRDRVGRAAAIWAASGSACGRTYAPWTGWEQGFQCFGAADPGLRWPLHAANTAGQFMAVWPYEGAIWFSTLDLE